MMNGVSLGFRNFKQQSSTALESIYCINVLGDSPNGTSSEQKNFSWNLDTGKLLQLLFSSSIT